MSKTQYKKYLIIKNKPKRIILIRTGESIGNIDKTIYETVPDSQIKLTETGLEQAKLLGEKLKELIKNETIFFHISPFERSIQTFDQISQSFVS
jgi:broad specificity phosphatase PhoE